jgi:hypothetical protein
MQLGRVIHCVWAAKHRDIFNLLNIALNGSPMPAFWHQKCSSGPKPRNTDRQVQDNALILTPLATSIHLLKQPNHFVYESSLCQPRIFPSFY